MKGKVTKIIVVVLAAGFGYLGGILTSNFSAGTPGQACPSGSIRRRVTSPASIFQIPWEPARPEVLRAKVLTYRSIGFPIIEASPGDVDFYGDSIAVDWLDKEIWGSPVVARMYQTCRPDLYATARQAILATLPDDIYAAVSKSLHK